MAQGTKRAGEPTRPDEWARLKIVRIIARLNVGVPARHVTILTDRLPAFGFETVLVYGAVSPGEASLEDEAAARAGRVLKISALGRKIHLWNDVGAAWSLWGVLRRERPDVIHTHTSKAGVLGRLVAAAYNLSRARSERALVVHTFHGHVFMGYFGSTASRVVRWTERALARVTDIIIAISAEQRDDLVSRYRIAAPSLVRVVPLGLEIDRLLALTRQAPGEKGSGTKPVTFGFLGRFVPVKDLPTLIDAFAMAVRNAPGLRLRLFGGGELRPALEARVRDLGLGSCVQFGGWQFSLPDVYAGLDAVVLTSRNEGTPVAIIEAQAAGLPVVATEVGGVRDLVRSGETGLLVPPGDPQAIAAALLRVAGSADLRWRLGQAGRAWVRQRFTAQRLTDDLNQLYRKGLAQKRGA